MRTMRAVALLASLIALAGCSSSPSSPGEDPQPSGIIVFTSDRENQSNLAG